MKSKQAYKYVLLAVIFLLAGSVLSLFLLWIPQSTRNAYSAMSPPAFSTTSIQGTPTVDPTITALEKENLEHENSWIWTYGASLATSLLTTFALLGGGIFTVVKWFGDRKADRERRDEQHFRAAVDGLGNKSLATRANAAITLRSFLRPGYEQFYLQTFDLVIAQLRLRPKNDNTAETLDSLSQALITIFKESFPLVYKQHIQSGKKPDAAHIQLDNAYLAEANLCKAWMPHTSLRKAVLCKANLSEADISGADLSEANLSGANLSGADLREAILSVAILNETILVNANLSKANLFQANLRDANLENAILGEAKLMGLLLGEANFENSNLGFADLRGANLGGANFSNAALGSANLSGANLFDAKLRKADLKGANLSATSLRKANLEEAILCGAILCNANIEDANLCHADLSWANLSGANLSGVNLTDANLSNANLTDANLSDCNLERTNIQNVIGLTQSQLVTCKTKALSFTEV